MVSLPLIAALVGIAAVDSLNPSLFVAQFYLLTTPNPIPRIASYIAGVLAANFAGGLLILAGFRSVAGRLLDAVPAGVLDGTLLVAGLALVAFGLWYRAPAADMPARKPSSLRPLATFGLGMAVMLNELTTALPYFVAIERITQTGLDTAGALLALGLYNLVFALPLLAFLLLLIRYRQRFTAQLERIGRALRTWTPRAVKYGSLAFGAGLSTYAGLALAAG